MYFRERETKMNNVTLESTTADSTERHKAPSLICISRLERTEAISKITLRYAQDMLKVNIVYV